jgi:hypothetical protein
MLQRNMPTEHFIVHNSLLSITLQCAKQTSLLSVESNNSILTISPVSAPLEFPVTLLPLENHEKLYRLLHVVANDFSMLFPWPEQG